MTEIVGFLINGIIHTGFQAIDAAKYNGCNVDMLVTRQQARFMDCCDLGPQWKALAQAKTIIILDENGARLPDGYYTNANREIFEIKNGQKIIIDNSNDFIVSSL